MPVSPDKDPYYRLRHSAAHVMAEAVLEEFPEGKIAIGPPIEDGFYYDFDLPRPLTPEDLTAIEERMRRIIKGNYPFEYREVGADAARTLFADQPYKLELIDGLAHGLDEYGETHHGDTVISTYKHDTFEDLCRGPHVERTGNIPPEGFKLLSVAGAYWRGDASKPMLQRIYGTAWNSKAELDDYLFRLEEAKRRDHRKLGKELGLFYFADDVGPGLPLFTPKGEMLRYTMESYVREAQTRYGYQHVWTGHMVKESLYHKSGHYENYSDVMFPPMEDEGVAYRLKPMNCPSHMTLFKEMGVHSYREWPLRFAEFAALKQALDSNGVAYEAVEGEAAFYGPKADFLVKDALGREWQLSTIQIDFIQPARLAVEYIGEDGQPHTPVLIHRAVTGSTERFLGLIIEHFAGAFPAWLAPVQAVIVPISDEKHAAYSREVATRLGDAGLRVELDDNKDRMQ